MPFTTVIACRRVGDVSDFQVGLRADGANRAAFWRDRMRRADDVQFDFGVLCTERRLIQAGAEAAAAGNGRCGFGAGVYQPPLCTQNAEVKLYIVRPPHTIPPKSQSICPVRV